MADKLGISEDTLYKYEQGKATPDVKVVDKLLALTNLKYEDIIFYE
ncbi:MAG: helix-turn-helix transcriptional regulator [Clostridia bacterium]|nr:helix-turn-helix transcriptional regulator [Clostridia bacterium]